MEMILYLGGGALAGFLYWRLIGCSNGICMLTQNKYYSMITGALIGFMLLQSSCSGTSQPEKRNTVQEQASVQEIHAADFALKMQDPNAVVIDVRTPAEFAEGHIPGAVNINVQAQDFSEKVLAIGQGKTYLLYCRSGARSGRAGEQMVNLGFSEIYNMQGGLSQWTGNLVQ